jgi:hypothetical protein
MNRSAVLAIGILAVIGLTWLWHGPAGAGEHLAASMEAHARLQLDKDEMFRVQAQAERDPLTRRLILSGPADDFQRREIKRRLELLPGVGEARWDPASLQAEQAQ